MISFLNKLATNPSNKLYITCPSYAFVSPVLAIIDKIATKGKPGINIIVLDEQMQLFWHQLITKNNLNCNLILLNTRRPGRFRDVLSWLKIRPIIRKLFEDYFASVENSFFCCCGSALDLGMYSLMKRVACKNTVVFLDVGFRDYPKHYSLRGLIALVHTWIFYGLDVTIRDVANQPYVYLSERFFKKLNIEHCKLKYFYDAGLLQKYNPVSDSYTLGKKILWLDDECHWFEKKPTGHSLNCLKVLKSIIDENFTKNEVLYKRHPNPEFQWKGFTSIYSDYEEYPSFMNADFISSNPNIKFILGGFSTVLSTAAKNTNIMAISYMKLIPFEDQKFKKRMIEFLMQESDQKILFLDSVKELNFLLRKNQKEG